jgi:hypothetical protein
MDDPVSNFSPEITIAKANTAPIICIHGEPGKGKSTLSAQFKDSVHILLEDGLPAGIEVQAIRYLTTTDEILKILRWLYESPHTFRTLVIDTADALEAIIISDVCQKHSWANIETPPYGKGPIACDPMWRRILLALNHLRRKRGMVIVLLAHSTVERIDDPRAPSFTSYQLRLQRRARGLVMDACDVVGFLSTDIHVVTEERGFGQERARADGESQRYLFLEGRPAFAAKNRYSTPAKIPIDNPFNIEMLTKYFPQTGARHMRRNHLLETLLQALAEHGATPAVSRRGKHPKVEWFIGSRRYVLTVSGTANDSSLHARKRVRANIRRVFRNHQEHQVGR